MTKKFSLSRQLLFIIVIIFGIITLSVGYLLPKVLLPIYENNIYTLLRQPLDFMNDNDLNDYELDVDSDVAYLYVTPNGDTIESTNILSVIKINTKQLLKKIDGTSGKFNYLGSKYYYISETDNYVTKIAITNDNYIKKIKNDILNTIFPILLFTLFITVGLVLLWSQMVIKKIEKLKEKVDNLDNDNYKKKFNNYFDDELTSLSNSIDEMKSTLKVQIRRASFMERVCLIF